VPATASRTPGAPTSRRQETSGCRTPTSFSLSSPNYSPVFNGALNPQTGRLIESGLSWTAGQLMQQFSVFQQENKNEIGYIAANGRNANLDPTRRRGAEWEGRWHLATAWTCVAALTTNPATFTRGGIQRQDDSPDSRSQGNRQCPVGRCPSGSA